MINDKCPGFSLIELLVVLALMAALALFLGSKINTIDKDLHFDTTCHQMEEIKEAIIGKPALYCNGIRQFTGYVSDMGALPGLFYVAEDGNIVKLQEGDDISEVLKDCKYPPQPKALWTRDMDGDGQNDIPDEVLWEYHEDDGKIWAGWRGPYITRPPGGVLRDAWGKPFVFITGELVTHNRKTCRCIKTHRASLLDDPALQEKPHEPGTAVGALYWQELSKQINAKQINAKTWGIHVDKLPPGETSYLVNALARHLPEVIDIFYDDAMEIISYGKDGKPGGQGLNKDMVLSIYRQEYTGEVAGHAGYKGNPYVHEVTLYYPKYTEQEGGVKSIGIASIEDNDNGYGICFRFGTACESYDPGVELDCDYATYVNFQKVSIPIGIRSIKAGGKNYIFAVTEGGNWMGTLK